MISDFVTLVRGHALLSAVLFFVERAANEYSGYDFEKMRAGWILETCITLHLEGYFICVPT